MEHHVRENTLVTSCMYVCRIVIYIVYVPLVKILIKIKSQFYCYYKATVCHLIEIHKICVTLPVLFIYMCIIVKNAHSWRRLVHMSMCYVHLFMLRVCLCLLTDACLSRYGATLQG